MKYQGKGDQYIEDEDRLVLFSNSKGLDRNTEIGGKHIRPRRLTFKNFDENTKEHLAFPSPMNKSPTYPGILLEQSESGLQEKELDFNFNEEQIFKDSFPNSPFIVPKQTPFFEKKFSMLMNQCHTPKRSVNGGNSIVGQHTPVNPWNQYLMGKEQAPSPIRFSKVENKLGMFTKSICETPDNMRMKKGFKEMDLQRFMYSGNKEGRLVSARKVNRRSEINRDIRKTNNMDFSFNAGNVLMKENVGNGSKRDNSASKIMSKMRSNVIQYDSDFMKVKPNEVSKSQFLAKEINNLPIQKVMNRNIHNNVTSFQGELNLIKPKKLFDSKNLINQNSEKKVMIENIQDFIEKSYSKIMEKTPKNSKQSNGLGMLFINAMNNIKIDSQAKPTSFNRFTSGDSSAMLIPYEKRSGFGESNIRNYFYTYKIKFTPRFNLLSNEQVF
jgi:hypothetical protein